MNSISKPRLLVFQHIDVEHPGIFREFLDQDAIEWRAVELDVGEPIPDLSDYDMLWVMGGPMDVWEEDEHPWLIAEKAAIREAVVERNMPFLGVCLGHQLLAASLGGEVGPSSTPEIGVMSVSLTTEAAHCPVFRGMAGDLRCLQWHSAEVTRTPPGARVLASSPACRVQAMQVGDRAFGIQYHVELTPTTVADWSAIPEYAEALDRTLGAGGLARFQRDADEHMSAFNASSRALYDNFMAFSARCR
ncbi:MAG: type 1 glutamine amidotransferase [Gammaproteobacteria bacterium]